MSLSDLLGRVGRPGTKAFEAPIRAIVHEVLREQGYASPAEVQSLRDEARDLRGRLDRVESRLTEVMALVEAARAAASAAQVEAGKAASLVASAPPAPAPVDDGRIAHLEAEVAHLQAELQNVVHAPVPPAGAAPAGTPASGTTPLAAAPRGGCKVDECEEAVRSKGFCSAHYQQWRRGTLKGFVGLDGTVDVDGKVVAVGVDHAGGRLTLDGNRVLVDGQLVVELAVA